jgi:hypothetical protein
LAIAAIVAQSDRGVQDALEMWIAHAYPVHVLERLADVVDARPAHADALRHQAGAAMQIELTHVRRMSGVGDERKRTHLAPGGESNRDEPRLVHAPRHLAVPEARERAPQSLRVNAVGDAPA